MDEHVLAAAVGLDEAVALLCVEPFDSTGSQSRSPLESGGSAPCLIGQDTAQFSASWGAWSNARRAIGKAAEAETGT
jgi:hypothetical protein